MDCGGDKKNKTEMLWVPSVVRRDKRLVKVPGESLLKKTIDGERVRWRDGLANNGSQRGICTGEDQLEETGMHGTNHCL